MIDGMATFTIVASTMIIETPRLSIARPSHRPRPLVHPAGGRGRARDCSRRGPAVAWNVVGVGAHWCRTSERRVKGPGCAGT